jgi:5-methylcytosine-specific restriction endonuclease McrA
VSTWGTRLGRISPQQRARVLDRDGGVCQLGYDGCTWHATIVDHVVPLASGGTADPENLQAVCRSCHERKSEAERLAAVKAAAARRYARRHLPVKPHPGDM